MKRAIGILVAALSLAGCDGAGVSGEDEAAAELTGDGKADEFGIAMGSYENAQPAVGTISTLVLGPAAEGEELPSYFEGHYQLTELRADGTHDASGPFNVYRYAGQTWIRFLVDASEGFGTTYEKYSVAQQDGGLVLQGHGADTQFTLAPVAAPQRLVTCTLTRVAIEGMPQGPGSTSASIDPDEEDAYGDSDGLDAFLGNYSFGISVYEGSLDVIFYENEHVQDEVGSMGCDLAAAVPGEPFCEEPITIDASLGTEDEPERSVDAFAFSCVLTVD
jgi:hypothetical protein